MNINIKFLNVFMMSFVIMLHINNLIYAQEQFLLNNNNLPEYKLVRQVNTYWQISPDSLNSKAIKQKWRTSENDDYYISYCEFDNEEDAIKETAYAANSCAMPFIFGSPTGEIIGNASWVALDGSAVCFQKGNLGIKIFKPVNFEQENRNIFSSISNTVLAKINIDSFIDSNVKEKELLKFQHFKKNYQKIMDKTDSLLIQDGFTEYKEENSKWLISKDSVVEGYRVQWSDKYSLISIDVVELSDSIDALRTSEFRSKVAFCPECKLDNNESVTGAINYWLNKWSKLDTLKYISVIGTYGNKSIHYYYYNSKGINTDKFYKIIKGI